MGALIFQEIREARGLAYSAGAYYADPVRKGDQVAVSGRIGTQVDKTIEAIQTLHELLADFEVDERRLETALHGVESSLRNERIEPRRRAAHIYDWEKRGFNGDPRRRLFEDLSNVSAKALRDFGRSETNSPPIIAIMSDSRRLPAEALKVLGKVIAVPVSDLFSYDD